MNSVDYRAHLTNNIFRILFCGIFIMVGLGLLAGGGVWYSKAKETQKRSDKVDGVISFIAIDNSNDSSSHNVYVVYEYDGITYENIKLSEYSSNMREGDVIELYVNEDKPNRPHVKGLYYLGPIIFTGIGSVFTIFGLLFLVLSSNTRGMSKTERANYKEELRQAKTDDKENRQRYEEKLARKKEEFDMMSDPRRQGARVSAEIIDCKIDYSIERKNVNPFRIYCRCSFDDGGERYFVSDPVWINLSNHVLEEIDVYVKDAQTAFVDVESFMKNKGYINKP